MTNDDPNVIRKSMIRDILRQHLVTLDEELGRFEQTTHGVLSNGTMTEVAMALNAMYHEPSSYNISTAAQHIHKFLERTGVQ